MGGAPKDWVDVPIQEMSLGEKKLVFVKDLTELEDEAGHQSVAQMAADLVDSHAPRRYLIAANHGQLLEKLKGAPQTPAVKATKTVVEEILVNPIRRCACGFTI